jgi:uncharacterized membrane protein
MALGGYYGYLVGVKKNKTAIKIDESLYLIFIGIMSICLPIFLGPILFEMIVQSFSVSLGAFALSLLPLIFLIALWIVFIKEIIKTRNKVK